MRSRFADYSDDDFANLVHDDTNPSCRHCPATIAAAATAATGAVSAAAATAAVTTAVTSAFPECTEARPCSICLHGQCRLCCIEDALRDEAGVDDDDYSRCMSAYTCLMDPTQSAVACGCCGVMDVPMSGPVSAEESEALGILTFKQVALRSTTAGARHSCRGKCSPDCPCFLAPLEYTSAELDAYNVPYPSHIIAPTGLSGSALEEWQAKQREDWLKYRVVISTVGVDMHGIAVSRVGFGTASSARDINGDAVGALSSNEHASLLHLYPELCTVTPASPGAPAVTCYTNVCGPCFRSLANRQRPDVSVANGWDLGTPSYASMPALSWAEKRAISKTRILCTALNLDLPRQTGNQGCN